MSTGTRRLTEHQRQVMELLRAGRRPMTVREVAAGIGFADRPQAHSAANGVLRCLKARGLVAVDWHAYPRRWRLAEPGGGS